MDDHADPVDRPEARPAASPPPPRHDDAADSSHDPTNDASGDADPEFGPSGYLPERAAKRARKIVLRAPLGLQWVIASLLAGVVVLVAGVVFLQTRDSAPPEPFVAVGDVQELPATRYDPDLDALIVTVTGRVRAFAGAQDVDHCAANNRLEAADGTGIWSLTGRGLDGTPSLDEHPTLVTGGVLYVDPTRTVPAPPPDDEPAARGCS